MSKAKKKKKSSGTSGGGVQQFLVWHGEKFVVAAVVVVALWFAWQGLGYPGLSWTPDELDKVSTDAQTAIRQSERSAKEENIEFIDFKAIAEENMSPIVAEPYHTEHRWNTEFNTRTTPRSSSSSASE